MRLKKSNYSDSDSDGIYNDGSDGIDNDMIGGECTGRDRDVVVGVMMVEI